MPIIRLQTNVTDQAIRRRVAEAIESIFVKLGLVREHITIVMTTVESDDLYIGGRTFAEHASPNAGFALVFVHMSRSRGDDVRIALARALVGAFGDAVKPQRLSVEFISREAEDVYIADLPLARRRNVDRREGANAPDPSDASITEDRVRQALAARWGQHVLTASIDTLLDELYPQETTWDSLAKAELAYYLEVVLDLSRPLDTGQEAVQIALNSNAPLARLVSVLEASGT